ncbi:hypothetical protein GH714_000568 [Hevea brasiliensis]|uniref:KOW domain-containing protein n=1 Tax=Hevea brasiliensis TaxID=3981 RepID=A0A6A6L5C4_HEVBR|nr:hypothetical protein GH714_000568 [Hevea brasiliensis]
MYKALRLGCEWWLKEEGMRPRRRDEDDEELDADDEEYDDQEQQVMDDEEEEEEEEDREFFDLEAAVDSDEEEEEDGDAEDGKTEVGIHADFIVDNGAELPEEDDSRGSSHTEYDEETTDVEQQALLPSVRDPKLWMVKCAIGRERETAVCLMQKYIDKGSELQIRLVKVSAIYAQKIMLVPIKEMTDVLSVESKAIDLSRDTWVRMKIGTYKGDLAKVVDVDNVRQRVTVKLIPRIDLQALANKLEGREVVKKKAFVPPPRFMNVDEARELHIRVERRRDPMTGDYFENIGGMLFKDGFLYKTVSMKSISAQNIKPTFDELEKFRKPGENGDGDMVSLSTLFENRKKGHFVKGDAVIIVKGDLKNLKGWVEKVDEENVHIKPEMKDLPRTIAVNEKELCKYFEPGNHVKVVSGTQEGATGMVVKVEQHVVIILSDTTKEHVRVFADDIVESSEVTTGVTKIGEYELHDLVLLDNMSFGVIIRVESEAFQVLKGVPERSEVALVRLREIKCKIEKKFNVQDRYKNTISAKDVVRIIDGPCKSTYTEESCLSMIAITLNMLDLSVLNPILVVVGGSRAHGDRNGDSYSRFGSLKTPPRVPASPRRFPRGGPPFESGGRNRGGRGGHDALVGTTVKIRQGPFKGYRGRVVEIKGQFVRVELESQMKVILVDRNNISDNVVVSTHTATPIHDGMRTPMRDRAWNPYSPMSPPRDNWEDGNPASWGASPQYQPGSPPSRAYEAPTPGSGWASTPGGSYSDAGTPRDNSSGYGSLQSHFGLQFHAYDSWHCSLPSWHSWGQPMTPGTGGLDVMSPVIGGDNEGLWFMPDILVNVRKAADESSVGVVREVLPDGSCRVVLGANGNGETITALPNEIDIMVPRKSDKIKIMGGAHRGATGKLIGVDGSDGIVKVDDTLDVKILDMVILAKLAQP